MTKHDRTGPRKGPDADALSAADGRMLAQVAGVIDATAAPDDQVRLAACLPSLARLIAQWNPSPHDSGLVLACATADHAILVQAGGWQEPGAAAPDRPAAALALVTAIAGADGERILAAASAALTGDGIAMQREDAARFVRAGLSPLSVVLVDHSDHRLAFLATTVAALSTAPAVGATVH